MSRPPNKPLPVTARLNFLLGASDMDLSNFELARLAEVAELRSDLHAILDKLIDEMAQAAVAGWFRQTTREKLKRAIEAQENPEARIAEVVAWAKERIKNGQRDDAELIPRTALAPGAAHLAARLRYAERNMAEGKCSICPKPLARNSVRYCDRHLAIQAAKKKAKGAKGDQPGTLGWLYGDGIFESAHNKAPSQIKALKEANEKRAKKAKENREQ